MVGCSCPGTTPTVGRSSPRYSSGRGTKGGLYGPCSQHPRGGPGLEWAAHTGSKPLGTAGEELLGWLGGSFVVSGDHAGEEAAGLEWAPGGTVPSRLLGIPTHMAARCVCEITAARGQRGPRPAVQALVPGLYSSLLRPPRAEPSPGQTVHRISAVPSSLGAAGLE